MYDGGYKCPEAYFLDVLGAKITLAVTGGEIYATESALAVTASPDPNYLLLNPSLEYSILPADYDLSGVYWAGGGFTYDGTRHNVYLVGLPEGITVIGYTDAGATDAGVYYASAALENDREKELLRRQVEAFSKK